MPDLRLGVPLLDFHHDKHAKRLEGMRMFDQNIINFYI